MSFNIFTAVLSNILLSSYKAFDFVLQIEQDTHEDTSKKF